MYSYSEKLFAFQDAALARAYNASLELPDDYYFETDQDAEEEEEEESE